MSNVPGMRGFPVRDAAADAVVTPYLDFDFTSDPLGKMVADQSTTLTGLKVVGGQLTLTDNADHSFHHASLKVIDAKHMLKVIPSGTPRLFYLCGKFIDASNFLMMQEYDADGVGIRMYQYVAGVNAVIGTLSRPTGLLTDPSWFVMRVIGNCVKCEVHTSDPRGGGVPAVSAQVMLTGAAIAALGAGVAGHPGMRHATGGATTSTWKVDEWVVAPISADRSNF